MLKPSLAPALFDLQSNLLILLSSLLDQMVSSTYAKIIEVSIILQSRTNIYNLLLVNYLTD